MILTPFIIGLIIVESIHLIISVLIAVWFIGKMKGVEDAIWHLNQNMNELLAQNDPNRFPRYVNGEKV